MLLWFYDAARSTFNARNVIGTMKIILLFHRYNSLEEKRRETPRESPKLDDPPKPSKLQKRVFTDLQITTIM